MHRTRVVIMGAAGRDFHNFNVVFRHDPDVDVRAFTAAQIPDIGNRVYPPELAGRLYPHGIPIRPESDLAALVEGFKIDEVVFSYSDVAHVDVMHKASIAVAHGASFVLLGSRATMLPASRPVISVCAVRTGAGKSPVARRIVALLKSHGLRAVVVRHPMPYGDLARQALQRFASLADLRAHACTIEEMEEYEPHLAAGTVVYAGVDYERILRAAEHEADVIVWDGGNNDTPFFVPDLEIVVVDPHRAGDERTHHPGEVNLLRAHVVVVNKVDTAELAKVDLLRENVRRVNPRAVVVEGAMPLGVPDPAMILGRRALVVEDAPTVTHGGMAFGAGLLAARRFGAAEIIDPRPFAVGTLRAVYRDHPHLGPVLPAMGYGPAQLRDLEETIRAAAPDVVVNGSPVDLARAVLLRQPCARVRYDFEERGSPTLDDVVAPLLKARFAHV